MSQQNIKFGNLYLMLAETAETCCSRCTQIVQSVVFAMLIRTDMKKE